jgi:Putative exporter of polyketide antibiotics
MPLYLRELKGNLKPFIIWTVCIVALTAVFMAMYPSFAEQGEAVNRMLEGFSPELMRMFGFDSVDFTQAMDYYGYVFQYALLAVMIQFMLAGASLVSSEEDSGSISFLYAKPVSRSAIAGTKFFAGLTGIAAFFIVYTAAVTAILAAVDQTGVDIGMVLLLNAAMALAQLMMLGIGMLLSMFITKARAIMSVSIGAVLLLYVAGMFASVQESLNWLKYFTPFQYFDARTILTGGSLEWVYVALPIGVALAGAGLSLVIYNRRDLKC